MHFSRSRVAVIATAGTAALLSLPVVAAGQVPSVGGVVGGVTDQLPSLPAPTPVPAPALPVPLPAPPVQAPAPAPSLPSAPSAPAPSLPAPNVSGLPKAPGSAPAPAGSPAGSSPSSGAPSADGSPGGSAGGSGPSSNAKAADGSRRATKGGSGRQGDGGSKAHRSSGGAPYGTAATGAATANTDAALASAVVAGDAADLPDNASPETAPFTGLQLAYLAALGLMAATGGMAVRRMARR